ncbi:MAG: amidinotransferase [Clostridium sp.]|uniref:dimethylarginine dimethylaminohydrolase family protein n=1 Tax=Clostridium sp. DSM 8431 TaxID=1761781 RepID=UPI0008EEA62C|nr:arginine deiminase family protein [Clostridium sp. DSM 8431]MCR4944377.1 amidinotransferase [Clostridium sp.]SFU46164.1 N-Dimethylarginine dimethylaminohydrolase [Clostridium sp. DSM 8431]
MKIYRHNDYGNLRSCLLCYPVNYKIANKSNEFYNKTDYSLAYNQYNNYINYLIAEGIRVRFLDLVDSSKQVYAKDVGFVIDNILFISKMNLNERQRETEAIKKFAIEDGISHYIMQNNIEGGDVAVGDNVVFVGLSSRTSLKAVIELQQILDLKKINKTVVPINFDNSMLHLDCVFSLLGKDSAIVSPYVYDIEIIKEHIKNIIEITKEEARGFGSNIVYLGDKRLVTSSISVGNKLKNLGYDVKIIDLSEIVKGEGSVDCATLAFLRE